MKTMHSKQKQAKAPKRHTHRTAAGLEDAIAVLNEVAGRLETAIEILREVRAGPHAYDPERPAGLRILLKRR